MKKTNFNQAVGIVVFISDHVNRDNTGTIYLRVHIERRKKEFNLNLRWPHDRFDKEKQFAMPRHKEDVEVDAVNMIINEAKSKANRIKLRYFSNDRHLTLEGFTKEFENYESRDNFIAYWKMKQGDLYRMGVISESTNMRHTTNYNRLLKFVGESAHISFGDINMIMVQQLDTWLRKKQKVNAKSPATVLQHNSVCSVHKTFKTYVNHAITDGHPIENPYDRFKFRFQQGDREALTKDEVQKLKDYYDNPEAKDIEREVLRKFLFSCYTGLRISDSAQINSSMVKNGRLNLATVKGLKFGKKVSMKLPDFALTLIGDKKGNLFEPIADQTCNRCLKEIARKVGIDKRLSFHVSRDTFGTLFIELGGDVATLKDLMGHTNVQTTMIYIKLSERRKDTLMDNFNDL